MTGIFAGLLLVALKILSMVKQKPSKYSSFQSRFFKEPENLLIL